MEALVETKVLVVVVVVVVAGFVGIFPIESGLVEIVVFTIFGGGANVVGTCAEVFTAVDSEDLDGVGVG